MSLQQQLLDLGELFNFSDLSTFTQNIPIEWVASALDLSAQATIRRRRLPNDQVLWLVLGMALFRDVPVHEVARRLNICAQGLASLDLPARSGITEARKRLGADPVEWLFRQTGNHWGCERYEDDTWQGLQVFAVDSALLRTPDTPALREHFGSGNTSTERQTPFPMLRLVALMNVRFHLILDAQLSPYRRSEMRLADEFVQQIPQHSVTLLDKGFWSADLLLKLATAGESRHWLIPARQGLVSEEVARYGRLIACCARKCRRRHESATPTSQRTGTCAMSATRTRARSKPYSPRCPWILTAPKPSPSCIRNAGKSNWVSGISKAPYNRMQ